METKIFNIPASKQSLVESQLGKFNKRAAKLDMLQLTWSWGKAYTQTISMTSESVIDGHQENVDVEVLFLPLEVTGDFIVIADSWEFVVALQHLQSGENIIRSLDNNFIVPDKYRTGNLCEHCQVKRFRKNTYVLRHSNGDIIRVGSSCIDDFLGGKSPENILNKAALVSELVSFMEGTATGGSGGDIVFPVIDFLAQTSAVIREHGWMSKAKSFAEHTDSTASRVLDNLLPAQMPVAGFVTSVVTQEDKDKATLTAEWAEDITDNECHESDYLHNLRAIVRSGMVGMRTVGFAASMLQAYDRHVRVTAPAVKSNSQYLGSIKERIKLELTLKFDFLFQSAYGEGHRYIFHDDNGNVLCWKASKDYSLKVDTKYDIKGTVKDHSEYKGVAQTILTRCEILGEAV